MNNIFETRDLYCAAFVYSSGGKFQGIRREGRICWFCFEDKALCEQLQRKYFDKTGSVIGKEFADAIRTLKDLVFAG